MSALCCVAQNLSDREKQVLNLAAQGHTDEGIAHSLEISISTVRGYWLRIRSKIGGASRAELVGKWVALQSDAAKSAASIRYEEDVLAAEQATDKALEAERQAMDEILTKLSAAQRDKILELRTQTDGRRKATRATSLEIREKQTSSEA